MLPSKQENFGNLGARSSQCGIVPWPFRIRSTFPTISMRARRLCRSKWTPGSSSCAIACPTINIASNLIQLDREYLVPKFSIDAVTRKLGQHHRHRLHGRGGSKTPESTIMLILGLNAFHGDASAALLADGQLISALEEERLNRIKHWAGLPVMAARACLDGALPRSHRHLPRSEGAHSPTRCFARSCGHSAGADLSSRATNGARIARVAAALRAEGIFSPKRPATFTSWNITGRTLASAFFASPF